MSTANIVFNSGCGRLKHAKETRKLPLFWEFDLELFFEHGFLPTEMQGKMSLDHFSKLQEFPPKCQRCLVSKNNHLLPDNVDIDMLICSYCSDCTQRRFV